MLHRSEYYTEYMTKPKKTQQRKDKKGKRKYSVLFFVAFSSEALDSRLSVNVILKQELRESLFEAKVKKQTEVTKGYCKSTAVAGCTGARDGN